MLKINEKMAVCEYCGAMVNANTLERIYDGRMVCSDCFDDMLYCEDCGARVPSEDAVTVIDRYGDSCIICPDCINDYYYCDECGRYVHGWWWNDNVEMCTDCADRLYGNLIQSYHEGHPNGLEFFGDANYSFIAGHIGIELEVTTDEPERLAYMMQEDGCRTDLYHLEHDCSVDGFEMIFQPMTLEYMREHLADIHHIFNVLNQYGATAESGNGLHVHISRTAFGNDTATQARRIALCMKAFAGNNYNRMRAASGRDYGDAGDWCRDNAGVGNFSQKKQAAATRRADRYLAVNVQNTNTVEFRIGRSTTDCDDFIRWIQTICTIVRRSESITPTQATDLDRWFMDAPKDLVAWLNNRDAMIREPLQEISTERYNEIIQNIARRICRNLWSMMDQEPTESEILRNMAGCTTQELRTLGYDR